MEITNELKDKMTGILTALFPNAKIYLFGSRATRTHQALSDIDIAIDTGQKIAPAKIDEANAIMASLDIPISVDVVDLFSVSEDMRKLIEKEKIAWKKLITQVYKF